VTEVPVTPSRSAVPRFIAARRSIRAFRPEPVERAVLDRVVEAACLAPAPHHSRPWRWVVVDTVGAKQALADGMGARWRRDLEGDGVTPARIDELVDASHAKITGAPALVLGCLTWDGLDRYPDPTRQRAEWGMALLSRGAAVENLMLSAADAGLASCWVAAPIFCPEAARDALALAEEWLPHALVLVGHPDPAYIGRERPPVPLDQLREFK
jgi:F420 biosynthesis protein FbiB-like protein